MDDIDGLQRKIKQLQRELEEEREEHEATRSKAAADLKKANAAAEEAGEEAEDVRQQLALAERARADIARALEASGARVKVLEENELAHQNKEAETIEETTALKARVEDLELQLRRATADGKKLARQLDEARVELESEGSQKKALERQATRVGKELTEFKKKMGDDSSKAVSTPELERLKRELSDATAKAAASDRDASDARAAVRKLETRVTELTEETEALKDETARLEKMQKKMKDELSDYAEKAEEDEETIEGLERSVQTHTLEAEKAALDAKAAQTEAASLRSQLAGVTSELEDARTALDEERREKTRAQSSKRRLELEIEEIRSQYDSETLRREQLERAKDKSAKEVKTLKKKLFEESSAKTLTEATVEGLQASLKETETKYTAMKEQARQLSLEVDRLVVQVDALEKTNQELGSRADTNAAAVKATLEQQVAELTEENDRLEAAAAKDSAKVKQLELAAKTMEANLKRELERGKDLEVELEKKRTEFSELQAETAAFEKRVGQSERAMQAQISLLEDDLEVRLAEVRDAKRDNSRLSRKLQEIVTWVKAHDVASREAAHKQAVSKAADLFQAQVGGAAALSAQVRALQDALAAAEANRAAAEGAERAWRDKCLASGREVRDRIQDFTKAIKERE